MFEANQGAREVIPLVYPPLIDIDLDICLSEHHLADKSSQSPQDLAIIVSHYFCSLYFIES